MKNLYLKLALVLIVWQIVPVCMVLFGNWTAFDGMVYSIASLLPAMLTGIAVILFHKDIK